MQGFFNVKFEGKKKDLEYLARFIHERTESDDVFYELEQLMNYSDYYRDADDNDETFITIGMEESGNISDIEATYFEEMMLAVPSLRMTGYHSILDDDFHTEFTSKANSIEVDYTEIPDPQLCALCAEEIDEDNRFIDEDADEEYEMYFCCEKHYMLYKIILYYNENDMKYDYDDLMETDEKKVRKLFNSIFGEDSH